MSWPEYIVQIEPHKEGDLYHMRGEPEPIVRCRDCKKIRPDIVKIYSNGELEEVVDYGYECKRTGLKTYLDGFCAWGERRNE